MLGSQETGGAGIFALYAVIMTSNLRTQEAIQEPCFEKALDYARVTDAIHFLEGAVEAGRSPNLSELAAHMSLSPAHMQRLFKRWAGLSPKQFMQASLYNKARDFLSDDLSVLEATYASGLSSPSRLHDLSLRIEAMTPGEVKQGGTGINLVYGVHDSPFGYAVLCVTPSGLAGLGFADPGDEEAIISDYQRRWPRAHWARDQEKTAP
jgi:AraC family transcriptional regulator of adaptative response/methylated-DNA-[protein]-cysteine methyltransferase